MEKTNKLVLNFKMENPKNIPDTVEKQQILRGVLFALKHALKMLATEVDRSAVLLESGAKTGLSSRIENSLENSIDNPISGIFEMSADIDDSIKRILNKWVITFAQQHKDRIELLYLSHTSLNNLHYSIVLKEDNEENRDLIFSFFDKYDPLGISGKYPVLFQFVPIELADKINYVEEIKLA